MLFNYYSKIIEPIGVIWDKILLIRITFCSFENKIQNTLK